MSHTNPLLGKWYVRSYSAVGISMFFRAFALSILCAYSLRFLWFFEQDCQKLVLRGNIFRDNIKHRDAPKAANQYATYSDLGTVHLAALYKLAGIVVKMEWNDQQTRGSSLREK